MCHTCLVLARSYLATQLSIPPLPLGICLQGKKWLRGYAAVNTSFQPWNMLVEKKVATQLRGYTVVKATPPPQDMLVREEVATRLRSLGFLRSCVAAQPSSLSTCTLKGCVHSSRLRSRVATLFKISFGVQGYSAVPDNINFILQVCKKSSAEIMRACKITQITMMRGQYYFH